MDGTSATKSLAWKVTQPVNAIKNFDIRVKPAECCDRFTEESLQTLKQLVPRLFISLLALFDFGENGKMALVWFVDRLLFKKMSQLVCCAECWCFTDGVDAQTGVF